MQRSLYLKKIIKQTWRLPGPATLLVALGLSIGFPSITRVESAPPSDGGKQAVAHQALNNPGEKVKIVNSLNDPGIDGCSAGECTLREAILEAETGSTIMINVTGQITLTDDQLVIDKDLIIDGPGANKLVISGNDNSRVFTVDGESKVAISGVTIAGGTATPDDEIGGGIGGGILNFSLLKLTRCVVSGNTATNLGGGIFNIGTLTIVDSVISDNRTEDADNGGQDGGGINNAFGIVTIIKSNIQNNSAAVNGGGISNVLGTLTIIDSAITYNSALTQDGGGVYTSGTVKLIDSIVSDNEALEGSGGGAYIFGVIGTDGLLASTGTTIIRNRAANGAGIFNAFGNVNLQDTRIRYNEATFSGGGFRNDGQATISSSHITHNRTINGKGGGIHNQSQLIISQSNILNNSAIDGGGIYNIDRITANFCTITTNSADAYAGGIFNEEDGTVILRKSVPRANQANNVTGSEILNKGTVVFVEEAVSFPKDNLCENFIPGSTGCP